MNRNKKKRIRAHRYEYARWRYGWLVPIFFSSLLCRNTNIDVGKYDERFLESLRHQLILFQSQCAVIYVFVFVCCVSLVRVWLINDRQLKKRPREEIERDKHNHYHQKYTKQIMNRMNTHLHIENHVNRSICLISLAKYNRIYFFGIQWLFSNKPLCHWV